MDNATKETLLKIAEALKKEAKNYYLRKYANAKILEQYLILKDLEKNLK